MVSDFGGVDLRVDCALCNAVLEDVAETGLPVTKGLADPLAEDGIAVIGVDGGVEEGAPTGDCRAVSEPGDVLLESVDVILDGIEAVGAASDGGGPGEVEGLGSEFFFVLKVTVDATFFEAGGLHDGVEGTALIAALIEERGSEFDDALPGCFAFAHAETIWSLSIRLRRLSNGAALQ